MWHPNLCEIYVRFKVQETYGISRHESLYGEKGLMIVSDEFYKVEIHQTTFERPVGLQAPELAFLLLGAEQVIEAVPFVESEIAFLVVGINKEKTATCLVERIDEPSLDEAEDIAAEMLALEVGADAETSNHHGGVAAVEFLAGNILLDFLFARAGNLLDAVVGERESSYNGSRVFIERETIVLAE